MSTKHPLHSINRIKKAERLAAAVDANPITRGLDLVTLTGMDQAAWDAINEFAGEDRKPSAETVAMTIGILAGRRV
jgi:hypothetical protein